MLREAAQPDVRALRAYLAAHHLTPDPRHSTPLNLAYEGTLDNISASFGVSFVSVVHAGRHYYGAVGAPVLPTAAATGVAGIVGLSNVPRWRPLSEMDPLSEPAAGSCGSNTTPALAPADVASVYNIRQAQSGSGLTSQGSGNIGIINFARTDLVASDAAAFWAAEGVPTPWPSVNTVFTSFGDSLCGARFEASLDVEWSGALAPATSAINIEEESNTLANYLDELADFANNPNLADVVSSSWGLADSDVNSSVATAFENQIEALTSQGIPFLAAEGECKGTPCSGNPPVGFPAALPASVGVGGTLQDSFVDTSNQEAWSHDFGGVDTFFGSDSPMISLAADNTFLHIEAELDGVQLNGNGTSFSAPMWAGIYSDTREFLGHDVPAGRTPLINVHGTNPNSYFDVTTGCSGSLCATAGFDDVTGFGTANAHTFFVTMKQIYP